LFGQKKARLEYFELVDKSKNGKLPEQEQAELDHYFLLEHLMRHAKIRAYQLLH